MSSTSRPMFRLPVLAVLAAVAGATLGLAFQPYGLWPLAFVGIAALSLIVHPAVSATRPRRGFALGYLFGFGLLAVSISWLHVLGIWIALALFVFESLFFGLLGAALSLLTRVRYWPVGAALAWVATEFAYARVPFGGFGWSRVAYAEVDSPLAGLFPFVGVVGVSLATAGVGQLLAWLLVRIRQRRLAGPRSAGPHPAGPHPAGPGLRRPVLASVLALAVLGAGGGLLRGWDADPTGTDGSVEVGIVQGNVPGRGIEAMGRARTVTDNHLSQTIALMGRARLGQVPEPDFVLWPENSTDIDPTKDATTAAVVAAATRLADVPIFVGAVMEGPGVDERQTSGLWYDPVRGLIARYDKRNLVPFGEWIPFRTQLLPVIPLLKEVGAQSVPGTRPGVLRVPVDVGGTPRQIAVGDVICFELAYDQTVYDTVRGGAQVLTVQSNNATYGGTGQIEQQFAITRARAMESRREIAVATTNSVSGFISRTGQVRLRTQEFSAASAVVTMPLRLGLTPALRIAPSLDRGLSVAAVLWLLVAVVVLVRRRRVDPPAWVAAPNPAERQDGGSSTAGPTPAPTSSPEQKVSAHT